MRRLVAACTLLVCSLARADEGPRFPGLIVQTKSGAIALPLERTRYDVEIVGPVAAVRQRQVWRCPMRESVDATYVASLPPGAALTGLTMIVGDRRAEGRLEPRREAWERYRNAHAGGAHALVAESADGLVEESLTNLRPGEVVEVELRYTTELSWGGGYAELRLPLVVAPRRDGRGVAAVPTISGEAPQPLPEAIAWTHRAEIHVRARGLPEGAKLESPTHVLELQERAGAIEASLRGGSQPADRDLVLRVAMGASSISHALAPDGSASLVAQLTPAPGKRQTGRDLVLVLDEGALRSPATRAQAWAALDALVARARTDDRVLVVRAGSTAKRSSLAPLPPGADLRAALKKLRADPVRDGGDLAGALRAEHAGAHDRPRAFILFTDAALEEQTRLVGDLRTADRLVIVALGASPDQGRLERWTRAPRTAAIVAPVTDAPAWVAERVDAASTIALLAPSVTFEGGWSTAVLATPPPAELAAGTPFVISARRPPGPAVAGAIVVRGRRPDGSRFEERLVVSAPRSDPELAGLLGVAYARRRLAALALARDAGDIASATALAMGAGVASEWTSFVAVDRAAAGPPSARLIAVPLPAPFAGAPDARATMSADRIRPGDPEVQIEAPQGATRVTLLLPTGELKPCARDPRNGRWVANFLIANDRQEGIYVVRVLIELGDGTIVRRLVRYQVDAAAPDADAQLEPAIAAPGAEVELIVAPCPRPVTIIADVADIGDPTFAARVRDDVEVVIVLLPSGELHELPRGADGKFRLRFAAPATIGRHEIAITARDGARNGTRIERVLEVR